ncbi:MAG: nucleoside triphosphate pyrophosphohydrolase [Bacillota bacterium]
MNAKTLILAGLGPGNPSYVPSPVMDALKDADQVYLRTRRHPSVTVMDQMGIAYVALDDVYERATSFDEVYEEIASTVLDAFANSAGNVVYATPGHPLVAEVASHRILERARAADMPVAVLPALSALEAVYASLGIDPAAGLEIASAYDVPSNPPSGRKNLIVLQLHDRFVASALKLALMEVHPPETTVTLIRSAGVPGDETREDIPLYGLDRNPRLDHLTSLFVPAAMAVDRGFEQSTAMDELVDTVARLRGPRGCPWDREQDHLSLRPFVLEEAYEVVDAIDQGDMHKLNEELGDLLLQVVLHAQISQEKGNFTLEDVARGLTSKLVRRHPHVFSGADAETPDDVIQRWEAIKAAEKLKAPRSLMDAIPSGPAVMRAKKAQQLAARVGFDWKEAGEVLKKLTEETAELVAVHGQADRGAIESEIGDVLFSVINYARHVGVDPEVALNSTVQRFSQRFRYIENEARRSGRSVESMTLDEMDALWEKAKRS